MEESINTKSIVLSRQDFRESDLLVSFYNAKTGKISLVARGAKKINSKLAGHTEPLNIVDLMIIRGKQYDYVGSIRNIETFSGIKNNYNKLFLATKIIKKYNKAIKDGLGEEALQVLIQDFLYFLEGANDLDSDIIYSVFLLKLSGLLGFSLSLDSCLVCNKKNKEAYKINISQGGIVCPSCSKRREDLTISDNCIKMLILAFKIDIKKLESFVLKHNEKKEFLNIVSSFEDFHLN
ncbi:DNA repair protein RecO [Candidatus Parcubacteria bacterium]|nr:MAG: DNA repair protein RecO [Candidatus Parcubacteria bacterium]